MTWIGGRRTGPRRLEYIVKVEAGLVGLLSLIIAPRIPIGLVPHVLTGQLVPCDASVAPLDDPGLGHGSENFVIAKSRSKEPFRGRLGTVGARRSRIGVGARIMFGDDHAAEDVGEEQDRQVDERHEYQQAGVQEVHPAIIMPGGTEGKGLTGPLLVIRSRIIVFVRTVRM